MEAVENGFAAGSDGRGITGSGRQRSGPAMDDGALLTERQFRRQLQLETRRCDRSGTPLSVVLLDVDLDRPLAVGDLRDLGDRVAEIKRETDLLAYLNDHCLAVMLLDTGADGAQAFLRNLAQLAQGLSYRSTVATYPDQLFEFLSQGCKAPADSLFVESASGRNPDGSIVKRLLDIAGSSVALLLLSPLLLATAVAIKLSSPGSVIHRQQRLGRGGVPFTFYKFRSMRTDADDSIHREYVTKLIAGDVATVNQGDADRPHYKIKSDPRVTRVGHLIRRTSIDELPQFFNVLKGDMSLVGPRPPLPYEAEKYKSWHLRRVLEIRPGITGLWQVEGRNKTSFDEMVRLDLRYIRDWSHRLDCRLLFRTVLVVLRGDGDA